MQAGGALLDEAERFAKAADWPCKRYTKEITEDFVGAYKLDRLVFACEGAQLALVPVGRFAPGTDGMFDLAVLPAHDSFMVIRRGNSWFIHPQTGEEGRLDWSSEAFRSSSISLARLP